MGKQCAICGDKIKMMSEYNLSKEHKNTKICLTCYEYVATAMKGNNMAVERLKQRYKDDMDSKISDFISSINTTSNISGKRPEAKKDEFMDLMSNDLQKEQESKKEKKHYNIIRLDKLSDAKKDRLIRIRIISSMLVFVFLVLGLLFSFYIFTQGYGGILALVMAIVSVGFAVIFSFIKYLLSIVLED